MHVDIYTITQSLYTQMLTEVLKVWPFYIIVAVIVVAKNVWTNDSKWTQLETVFGFRRSFHYLFFFTFNSLRTLSGNVYYVYVFKC